MKRTDYSPSLLRGFTAKESTVISWIMVVNHVTGGGLLELTERYRKSGEHAWKSRLPSITPACQLNGTGKEASDVVGLTGATFVDLDGIPESDIERVRAIVNGDPHTFLSKVSASGRGFHIVARWEGGDYAQAFLAANCHYSDLTGYAFDEKCSNVNRLMALSHDPKAFFNESAQAFEISPDNTTVPDDHKVSDDPDDFRDLMDYAVRVVEKHGETYTRGNRHTYLMKCLCMMNKLGINRYEAERWALSFDLGEKEVRTLCKSVYNLYAAQHGSYGMQRSSSARLRSAEEQECRMQSDLGYGSGDASETKNLQTCNLAWHSPAHTREGLPPQGLPQTTFDVRLFPDYQWPSFIQQMIGMADSKPQMAVLLISVLTVLGAMLGKLLRFKYSHRYWYPCLQVFVIAPPASGKSVLTWARHLAEPYDTKLERAYEAAKKQYDKAKAEYDSAGKERANMVPPELPKMKVFLIAGNNTSSGIIENLEECGGWGLICESEADTLSAAINSEYGKFSDILRKSYDHDLIKMYRRTGKERRHIPEPCLSVLVSGTPAQCQPLLVSAESGQFSRELFMTLPVIEQFIDQFDDDDTDIDSRFKQWGEQWLETLEKIRSEASCIEFRLSATQRHEFNEHFSQLFHHAGATHANHHMKSSVAREAINIMRLMSVVAFFRALEAESLLSPAKDIPHENICDGVCPRYDLAVTDEDFHAVMAFAEPLYRNACDILTLLPATEAVRQEVSPMEQLLTSLPMTFSRKDALDMAAVMGIGSNTLDSHISRLCNKGQLVKLERGMYAFENAVAKK